MPKNKSKDDIEDITFDDLPVLRPEEHMFLDLYMYDPQSAKNATACYKRAFPDSGAGKDSMHVLASRLLKKVQPWLSFMTMVRLDEKLETRDSYLSWLKSEIAQAKAAGNYGAAMTGIKHYADVVGFTNHDKTINVNHRSGDQAIEALIALHKEDPENFPKDKVLNMAPHYGVRGKSLEMLENDLKTVH